jgi:hypothetical protein
VNKKDKLSECQYWLMNAMLCNIISTQSILPDKHGGTDHSPFVDIFTQEEKISSLLYLFEHGYLLAIEERQKIFNKNIFFTPDQSQIEDAITINNNDDYYNNKIFYMCLSKRGGEKWESLSSPNWGIYTTILREFELNINGEKINRIIVCGKKLSWAKKRMSSFLDALNTSHDDYLFPNIIESKIFSTNSCKPIYWKDLGRCHLIMTSFNFTSKDNLDLKTLEFHGSNRIEVLSTSIEDYWYTHPYGEFHFEARNKLIEMGYGVG